MDWITDIVHYVAAHLLTILIFLPTVGAVLVLLARQRATVRWLTLGTCIATFVLSLFLFATYNWKQGEGYKYADQGGTIQMVQTNDWIPAYNIQYKVGIDGLSFPLVLLCTFICLLACIASWNIEKMTKGYMVLFLLLESGILGVFFSLDFFLFYVFFEVSLLPMYFLIGIWGGPRKEYAAIKFFLFTLVGSIGLLIVLIGMYLLSKQVYPGTGTFDLVKLAGPEFQHGPGQNPPRRPDRAGRQNVLRPASCSAFLIKVPAVPLHTWLPDAHVEAPTPISMILAASS